MLLAVVLTGTFSASWGIWTWNREKEQLRAGVSREGTLLVSTMAIPILNALLYEELGIVQEGGLLDNFVADIMSNRQLHPLYAVVLHQDGRVLAHNRLTEYGNLYQDPLTRSALSADAVVQSPLVFEGESALDFAAPLAIGGKRWGCLRVGVSLVPLEQAMARLLGRIMGFAAIFSAGALVLFYLAGRRLAYPLIALARQMEDVQESAQPYAPGPFRKDEIGHLQKSFSRMMGRLQKSEESRQASQQRMLENERLATIGMIVSGVAHEVNNPLAGIQGALYHLERKGGEDIGKYTGLIAGSVERIGRIVGQLLDLSRSGAVEMEKVESDVFFEDLAMFAKMALKGRKVLLEAKDLCPPQALILDRDKVHQVVLNLVLNAADAAPESGQITLHAYDFEGMYCIRVSDPGPGVPEAIRERIFDPFFTTKGHKGTGLGLSVSYGIIQNHGGQIDLETEIGKGTTFSILLPLSVAEENTPSAPPPISGSKADPGTADFTPARGPVQ